VTEKFVREHLGIIGVRDNRCQTTFPVKTPEYRTDAGFLLEKRTGTDCFLIMGS